MGGGGPTYVLSAGTAVPSNWYVWIMNQYTVSDSYPPSAASSSLKVFITSGSTPPAYSGAADAEDGTSEFNAVAPFTNTGTAVINDLTARYVTTNAQIIYTPALDSTIMDPFQVAVDTGMVYTGSDKYLDGENL
jgi:uncharacterized membrane protein (UPF0182 family)